MGKWDKYKKNEDNKKEDNNQNKTNINWYPGHMAKTKKQIIEDLKLIDVVIEILDARIPISSRNPDMQNITKNKKRLVILNKSDLANESETLKWINYFKDCGITAISTDLNSGTGVSKIVEAVEKITLKDRQVLAEKGRIGKPIRVLVLGIPNVGKSSFINRISKKNTMEVGNRPGVTKQKQWIRLSNNIELLDTPGILWPKFEREEVALNLSFTGTIKDEILPKIEIAYKLLKFMFENYRENVLERYKLNDKEVDEIFKNESNPVYELMLLIGKKRGCIVSGGNVDDEKVSNIILDDFRNGKLGKITLEKVED